MQSSSSRVHISFEVADLAAATRFYATLFAQAPTKQRTGYAKFDVKEPNVNLSLVENPNARPDTGKRQHFGIEVTSEKLLAKQRERVAAAGLGIQDEGSVDCCYSKQDKFWVYDPSGNAWEFFLVTGDSDKLAPDARCCDPGCCLPAERASA